jgi:hypothetical protein
MSYYDEQEEAWFANDCKGSPSDYDPYDADSWPKKVKRHKPRSKQPLHCLSCGAEIKDNGMCPSASGNPQKNGKLVLLVNCYSNKEVK